LKDGNEERLSGILNLSATGFSAILEGPLSENSSFFVAAKRSYLDLLFTLAGFGFIPQYWDFQAKYSLKVDERNSFSVLALGALDDVKLNNEDADKLYTNSQVAVPDQKQYFIGATWKRLYNNGYSTITFGRSFINFETFQNDSLGNMIFKNFSNEGENTLKADCDLQIAPRMSIYFGNQLKFASSLDYDVVVPGYLREDQNGVPRDLQVDTSFTAIRNATYFNLTGSMMDKIKYSVGARIDYYNYTSNELNFSPRLSATYQINPVSAIIMSLGRYVQAPSYIWLIGGSTSELNPLKSDLAVIGYQHTPLEDVKVQVELYYKKYWNYPARVYRPQAVLAPSGFDDATSDIPFGLEPLMSSAQGLSRGIELLIQKKLSDIPVYGILSLSYSQTEFTSIEGKERTGAFDSRFIGNLSFGWRLSRDWEISSRFRIATGLPTTPFKDDLSGDLDFKLYNEGERLPLFNSLDLRIDKRWFFQNTSLITYIDIQNIYSRQNISGYRWDYRTNSPEAQESIGILPSIGITLEF
jgi:hypothetical protein